MEAIDNPVSSALEAAAYIKEVAGSEWELAIILGSGLSQDFSSIKGEIIEFDQIPGFMISKVKGHPRKMVFGELGGKKTVVMMGRYHCYEGYSAAQTVIPILTLAELGVKDIIITNAAGGLNPIYAAGDFMTITDHINLTSQSPLTGISKFAPEKDPFLSMKDAYDVELINKLIEVSVNLDTSIHQGVYVAVNGPQYETEAELKFLKSIGGDAVGMSTVHEVIAARFVGMKVLAVSVITNLAFDGQKTPPSHREVLKQSQTVSPKLFSLIKETVKII